MYVYVYLYILGYCPICGNFSRMSLKTCPNETCNKHILAQEVDYENLTEAVVWTSVFGDIGMNPIQAGDGSCSHEQVLSILKFIRPYRSLPTLGKHNYEWQCYFITHLIFVLSSWAAYRLDVGLVLEEYVFLLTNMDVVIKLDDPELVGEFAHALRIMGCPDTHVALLKATVYLLEKERTRKLDGAWVGNSGNTVKLSVLSLSLSLSLSLVIVIGWRSSYLSSVYV